MSADSNDISLVNLLYAREDAWFQRVEAVEKVKFAQVVTSLAAIMAKLELVFGMQAQIQKSLDVLYANQTAIREILKEIKMTDQEVKDILTKVDATTTKIGINLDSVAQAQVSEVAIVQSISDEIDALVANAANNGISTETAALLTGIADRLQISSDNSDKLNAAVQAQVPVLTAIAAKGAPVVPPPPPPPAI